MEIKMLVTDLDGTLLRSDLTVSEYTKTVLRRCREAGIRTVIATGRGQPAEVAPMELFDGVIANNGANIFYGGREIRRTIPYQAARPLLLACDRMGVKSAAQKGYMFYCNFDPSEMWPGVEFQVVDFSELEIEADKLDFYIELPETEDFIRANLPQDTYLVVSRDRLGQVMRRAATKSAGVDELARLWGIEREEIAAFGDDLNDIDMLLYAGTGVAVANALDEVKAAAGSVCQGNDADGLAKWVEEHIL